MPTDVDSCDRGVETQSVEAGFTLVEMLIVTMILSVVMAIGFGLVVSLNTTVAREDLRSQANDQARLAVQEIDRQVRSGDVFYDPASETDSSNNISPGLALRVFTQANSANRCVQWRIFSGNLQTRSWTTTWQSEPATARPWLTVATGITNTTTTPAFVLDSAAGYGNRVLNIDILVNIKGTASTGSEIVDSVTGRNTEFGYSPNICSTIPPYS